MSQKEITLMTNTILAQLTPQAKRILNPRHRVFKTTTARRTLYTANVLFAAAQLLDAEGQLVAAHVLHLQGTRLLEHQSVINRS